MGGREGIGIAFRSRPQVACLRSSGDLQGVRVEASREGRERPELEGAKELRDEFVPSYSYILEILMEEAAEEEEKKAVVGGDIFPLSGCILGILDDPG